MFQMINTAIQRLHGSIEPGQSWDMNSELWTLNSELIMTFHQYHVDMFTVHEQPSQCWDMNSDICVTSHQSHVGMFTIHERPSQNWDMTFDIILTYLHKFYVGSHANQHHETRQDFRYELWTLTSWPIIKVFLSMYISAPLNLARAKNMNFDICKPSITHASFWVKCHAV